uniref:uncharacterized protein isoform X2 n=1 Tax=Myxine glutinosa TaxID=7769 RepID=UPI00358F755C
MAGSCCSCWASRFEVKYGDFSGYVLNVQDAVELIRQYELETSSAFIITNQTKGFGYSGLVARPHRVCWRDTRSTLGASLAFDGIPYIVLGKRRMECQNGPDRNKALKERLMKEKQEANGVNIICKHKTIHSTKKLGCSALIIIREIAKLPQFKIDQDTKSIRGSISRELRGAIKQGLVQWEKRLYISLPRPEQHHHPNHSEHVLQPILDDHILMTESEVPLHSYVVSSTGDLSFEERRKIAAWMEVFENIAIAKQSFFRFYRKSPPSDATMQRIHNAFVETGSICDV